MSSRHHVTFRETGSDVVKKNALCPATQGDSEKSLHKEWAAALLDSLSDAVQLLFNPPFCYPKGEEEGYLVVRAG